MIVIPGNPVGDDDFDDFADFDHFDASTTVIKLLNLESVLYIHRKQLILHHHNRHHQ